MRTSSRSLRKPLKMGTRSAAVNWSPRITASSWMENARVRRTFHWEYEHRMGKKKNQSNSYSLWIKKNPPCVILTTTYWHILKTKQGDVKQLLLRNVTYLNPSSAKLLSTVKKSCTVQCANANNDIHNEVMRKQLTDWVWSHGRCWNWSEAI